MTVPLAIFDLDSTLIDRDCELIWVQFMLDHGMIERKFLPRIQRYCVAYEIGSINYAEYERYLLSPLKNSSAEQLQAYLEEFMITLRPYFRPYMLECLEAHRRQGHALLLATASNHLLAQPIASVLGIPNLICTWMEMKNGLPTGETAKPAPFRREKVKEIERYAARLDSTLAECWGYSDSHNDLPFLSAIGHPVAVTPDLRLRAHARRMHWPIIEKPA